MKRSNRSLAVILNEDVEDLGFAGELVDVKPGFARNFLLPGGKAVVATAKAKEQRAKEIAAGEEKRQAEITARQELAGKIEEATVQLSLKVGPGHQIFGSITAREVAKALKDQHELTVDAKQLAGLPVKALGSQTASAKLGLGVTAIVHLQVSGEATKAEPSDKKLAKA